MPSVSMVVAKDAAGVTGHLDRVLLARRGRARRAALAHHLGLGAIVLWVIGSTLLARASGSDAAGTIAVLALLVVPVAGFAAWWGARHPVVAISVHELGIVRREPGRSVALAWTDVAEVFERTFEHEDMLGKRLRGSFTFVAHDGRTLVVDSDVPDWRELGRAASERAQDATRAAYELGLVAGRPLRFGELVMDGYGLHTKDGAFPWGAVTFVRFERRGVEAWWAIHLGAWMVASRVPHDRVANARTLVTILDRLGKLDVPGAAVLAEVANVAVAA